MKNFKIVLKIFLIFLTLNPISKLRSFICEETSTYELQLTRSFQWRNDKLERKEGTRRKLTKMLRAAICRNTPWSDARYRYTTLFTARWREKPQVAAHPRPVSSVLVSLSPPASSVSHNRGCVVVVVVRACADCVG